METISNPLLAEVDALIRPFSAVLDPKVSLKSGLNPQINIVILARIVVSNEASRAIVTPSSLTMMSSWDMRLYPTIVAETKWRPS